MNRSSVWKHGDGGGTTDTKYYGSRIARCKKGMDAEFRERKKSMKSPR